MKKWCLLELQIKLRPHSSKMSQNKCTRGKQEDYEKVLQYLKEGIHENLREYWDTVINITNGIIVKISRRTQTCFVLPIVYVSASSENDISLSIFF